MGKKNSEEINFQHYVDAVKQKNITWNLFVDFIKDLSYFDMDRLRHLNAILMAEFTVNCSNMDKMKYLNGILLTELKMILREMSIMTLKMKNLKICKNLLF